MRYTFQQLLEYQNKRNIECDQSKVDAVVDDVLAQMENKLSLYPTIKRVEIYNFTYQGWVHQLNGLTQAEQNEIIYTLLELGFAYAKFERNDAERLYIKISWE